MRLSAARSLAGGSGQSESGEMLHPAKEGRYLALLKIR